MHAPGSGCATGVRTNADRGVLSRQHARPAERRPLERCRRRDRRTTTTGPCCCCRCFTETSSRPRAVRRDERSTRPRTPEACAAVECAFAASRPDVRASRLLSGACYWFRLGVHRHITLKRERHGESEPPGRLTVLKLSFARTIGSEFVRSRPSSVSDFYAVGDR